MHWAQTIHDLHANAAALRRRGHGVIEAVDGRFAAVQLRPWPKEISVLGVWWQARRVHHQRAGDCFTLFYNQPRHVPDYLALKYVISTRGSSYASLCAALGALDEIARIKQSAAIVCEVSNLRISDRLMRRLGWEAHLPESRRRHFIKRFAGGPVSGQLATALLPGR